MSQVEDRADLTHLPNTSDFDPARGRIRDRTADSKRAQAGTATPTIIVNNHLTNPLGDVSNSPQRKRKHDTREDYSSDDSSKDYLAIYPPISTVLQDLHKQLPVLDFLQYQEVLVANGIAYANIADQFDEAYYRSLGMKDGAVKTLVKYITKVVRGVKAGVRKGKALRVETN